MPPNPARSPRRVRICLWGLWIVLAGCGGNPASVTGVVTMDGEPLERGKVGFTPVSGGMKATGKIDSSGYYELKTNRAAGLQVGTYQVTVISTEPGVVEPGGGPPIPGKSLIPKRYGRTKTSDLQFTVESGSNTLDIELTSEGLEDGDAVQNRGQRR